VTATTAVATTRAEAHLTFTRVVRSEWIKLRTLRSTWWCAAVLLALSVLMGVLISAVIGEGGRLPASQQEALAVQVLTLSVNFTQLVAAVLGVLVISGEYGTGMIRSTFAAVPLRIPAVVAKLLVLAVAVLVLGLVSTALTALASAPLLAARGIGLTPDAALWLPVLGGSVYLTLIAVLAFAIGALLRNSAGGIATALGLLLVVPIVVQLAAGLTRADWLQGADALLPSTAGAQLFTFAAPTGSDLGAAAQPLVLNGWGGLGVLVAWIAVFLVPALILVRRRDV
jgi:ABC-2 type transport system permease protein